MKVLIIIPAYNEAKNITSVVNDVRSHCPAYDILVVNDCSQDDTKTILKTLDVKYLDLPVNLGIGGAVQSGYKYALEHEYDIAVQFDGDGQHDAAYLEKILTPIADGEADLVIGSRFIEKRGFQSSAARRIGINFLSKAIKLLGGTEVLDVTSGMRAAEFRVFSLFAENYAQDYPEPESVLLISLSGLKIMEVPVNMRERSSGHSSISSLRSVYYMIKVSIALVLSRITMTKR